MKKTFHLSQVWDTFENSQGSQHVYGLTVTPDGGVLAFTEARTTPRDESPHHLVCKRGEPREDGAVEWGQNVFLERGDNGTCWANPAALTDDFSGKVFIFYVMNLGGEAQSSTRVFLRESGDGGRTWSERRELTELFTGNPYGWTFHMSGPGHGLRLSKQPNASLNGRLLTQFWHRRGIKENPRHYGVSLIHSDDHGKTWTAGMSPGPQANINESRVEELSDGSVILNCRGARDGGVDSSNERLIAISRDGGISFSEPKVAAGFSYCGIDTGILRVETGGEELLLMSHPFNPSAREDMGVSVSRDGGHSWRPVKIIEKGPCQYSDLCSLSDGRIGLLWGACDTEGIAQRARFASFELEWLLGK